MSSTGVEVPGFIESNMTADPCVATAGGAIQRNPKQTQHIDQHIDQHLNEAEENCSECITSKPAHFWQHTPTPTPSPAHVETFSCTCKIRTQSPTHTHAHTPSPSLPRPPCQCKTRVTHQVWKEAVPNPARARVCDQIIERMLHVHVKRYLPAHM